MKATAKLKKAEPNIEFSCVCSNELKILMLGSG